MLYTIEPTVALSLSVNASSQAEAEAIGRAYLAKALHQCLGLEPKETLKEIRILEPIESEG